MSDSMDNLDSLNDTPVTNDNSLPPDLKSLHHRVLRDSEQWRAALPGTDALAGQVAALAWREPESRSPSYGIREEIDVPDSPQIEPSLFDRPALRLRPRFRAGGFLAASSVLILVALFAVLCLHGWQRASRRLRPLPGTECQHRRRPYLEAGQALLRLYAGHQQPRCQQYWRV